MTAGTDQTTRLGQAQLRPGGRVRRSVLGVLLAGALGAACATPPKPRELEAFDNLRKANEP